MKKKDVLAFGIEPSTRKRHLRLARYMGLIDAVREFRERRTGGQERDESLKLLDVGAGHGRTLQYLKAAGLDGGVEFYGVDIGEGRRDRLHDPERWNFQLLDVEKGLPFEENTFNIVICEQVLEHLKDPEFVLREIARVIKPGGMAVLGVPNFPPGVDALRRHVVPRIDRITGRRRGHEQVFTKSSFINLIERGGEFKVRKVQAFRCISGGALAWLENYDWWYRLNRRIATANAAFAIEVQAIAERVPAGAAAPQENKPAMHQNA